MIEVDLKATWLFTTEAGRARELPILELLQAIDDYGKLTIAAQKVGLSYRHTWDLLDRWGNFFGHPLVVMHKGRGAVLSPLGEKLLWAEKRVRARLTAQLTNLASELEVELNNVVSNARQVVRMHASHGFAVAELRELLHNHHEVQLDLQYRGSGEALSDLCQAECDLAGFHVPEGDAGVKALIHYRKWLKPQKNYRIIRFVTRRQGFMVKKDNPLAIHGVADLARPGIRFVNREPSSGTRLLFDMLREETGVNASRIQGYQKEELTHNAVAAYVASDMADVGFGVEAAARQFNLEFIPVYTEQYYLMGRQETLDKPGIQQILDLLKSDAFRQAIDKIPGYEAQHAGDVETLQEVFPTLR